MKAVHKYPWALPCLILLTGCVDNSYDLDNINTDVEVKINNLTIPVNLDAIELSSAFDLDDESAIKEIKSDENGYYTVAKDGDFYAVVVNGDFKSNSTIIPEITVKSDIAIQPIVSTIVKYEGTGAGIPAFTISGQQISYQIKPQETNFSFKSTDVDNAIRDIYNIKGNWNITVTLMLSDDNDLINNLQFKDLVLSLPAGIHISNTEYNCNENGEIFIGNLQLESNKRKQIALNVDEIDFNLLKKNDVLKFEATTGKGSIDINGKIGVKSGFVIGGTNATGTDVPQHVTLSITPSMGNLSVNSISGKIAYSLDGFKIDDVTLDDLPDMLRQEDTRIRIDNPQLYLSLNNPVASYGLTAQSGLSLIPMRDGIEGQTCSLDDGNLIELKPGNGDNYVPHNICIAPTDPKSYFYGYADPANVGFADFSDILWGNGLPDRIKVKFVDPKVKEGDVFDFRLGGTTANPTVGAVKGNYTLFAPLTLGIESQIIYSEKETGWSDDDIEKIKIGAMSVNATVYNPLPVAIKVEATPLDSEGHPLKDNKGNQVKLKGLEIQANTEAAVELKLDLKDGSYIKGIDGIEYSATCVVQEANRTLRPTETITVKNIRITVSGSYADTL